LIRKEFWREVPCVKLSSFVCHNKLVREALLLIWDCRQLPIFFLSRYSANPISSILITFWPLERIAQLRLFTFLKLKLFLWRIYLIYIIAKYPQDPHIVSTSISLFFCKFVWVVVYLTTMFHWIYYVMLNNR